MSDDDFAQVEEVIDHLGREKAFGDWVVARWLGDWPWRRYVVFRWDEVAGYDFLLAENGERRYYMTLRAAESDAAWEAFSDHVDLLLAETMVEMTHAPAV